MMGMRRFAWALLLLSGCPVGDLTSDNDGSTQPDVTSDIQGDVAPPNDATTKDVQDAAVVDSPSDAPLEVGPNNITFVNVATAFGSDTINFPQVANGHTIIACVVSSFLMDPPGVVDGAGNTYTKRIGPINAGGNGIMYLYTVLSSSGGPMQAQVKTTGVPDGSTAVSSIYIAEYSGITAFDVVKNGTSYSAAVDGLASPAASVVALPSLIVGWALANQNIKSTGTSFTFHNGDNGDLFEDRIVVAPGSYAATATQNDDGGGRGDIFMAMFH
jgi:hypothetical protein